MAPVSTISPEIRAEAAAWLARLRADNKSVADESAFRVWLAKDPRHPRAFETVTEIWEVTGAAWNKPVVTERRRRLLHRRALLTGAGSLAAAGVLLTVWQRAGAATLKTAVGEQKHAVLPDGTQAFLDTDTKIRTTFDGDTRLVAVAHGRCNFHVRESDARPFVVIAANARIVSAQATFDVRRDGEDVCVVLTQGSASIGPKDSSQRQALARGDRFMTGPSGSHKDRPNLAPLLAWQTGQAIFDNNTVAGAIREMNRYSMIKITTNDNAVGKMRLSGVYRVGDNVAFAHSIATLLPVILEIDTDQVRLELDPARVKRT
jgi:transmembrane sensor